MSLFDPARHEPLAAADWSEPAVREWIAQIADDADRRFSPADLWPVHPLDRDAEGDAPTPPSTGLYMGAAGVIWALEELARRGHARAPRDYAPLLDDLVERNRQEVAGMGSGVESLLLGQSGVLLLAYRLAASDAAAQRLAASVGRNAGHPSNELLWGEPGTMHAALALHEQTGDARWADAYRAGAATLAQRFAFDERLGCGLWTQDLYGKKTRYLGPAHGFAGNAAVVLRGEHLLDDDARAAWRERIVTTALKTAVCVDGRANWAPFVPPDADARDVLAGSRRMVQWCHGAPGMVTSLATLDDPRLDEVLVAAAELVWEAGPLAKGGGLCHGTAGNGFAFLKLHARTGDERWIARARAFALHAIAQCDAHAVRYGCRRDSLWTGDLGTAWYAAACIDGVAALPQVEPDAAW